ncbi:MAG: hypothetical protein JOY52_16765, partial [Hyphomicrobiales bacterium]|nr:hypothetical protein [Hyphomicrobiales bacterium]
MSDSLTGFVIAGLAAAVWLVVVLRANALRKAQPARAPEPAPSDPPVRAASDVVVETVDIAGMLAPLAQALSPRAEEIGHPRELPALPEFQAVLATFRRSDATL